MTTRRAAAVSGVLAALAVGLAFGPGAASAADPELKIVAAPVTLRSTSSYGISDDAVRAFSDTLYDTAGRVTFSNSRLGDGLARSGLIEAASDGKFTRGEEQYAISGVPFTADEQAAIAAGPIDFIKIPFHPVGLGLFVSGPSTGGAPGFNTVHMVKDPTNDDPFINPFIITGGPAEDLDGKSPDLDAYLMKLPWRNATAMLSYTTGTKREDTWYSADLMALWGYTFNAEYNAWKKNGTDDLYLIPPEGGVPRTSTRFEPSADNLYLQTAFDVTAPDLFAQSIFGPAVPSEQWLPVQPALSRGLEQILALLALPEQPQLSKPPVGTMAPMPTWGLKGVRDLVPGRSLKLWVAQLQNGAGQWVAPTSDAITRSIAAGGDTPLYALSNPVDGGYPLTWVESLYAPATGLSIDETNALAAYIRYVVTDGQAVMRADGDGVLTTALVNQALKQANAMVQSNCAAAGGVAVAGTESPYYPAAAIAPKLAALGAQQLCATKVAPAATTTTTVAPTTTTTLAATTTTTLATTSTTAGAVASGGATNTGGGTTRTTANTRRPGTATTAARSATTAGATTTAAAGPTTSAVAGATTTTVAPSTGTTTAPQVLGDDVQNASATLPFGLPSTGRLGYDRVTTMLLGGILVYSLRRRLFLRRRTT